MREPFVATPHGIKNYMMVAKLNSTQNMIINAVERFTYGFGKEWARLSLSMLAVLIDSDKRQVTRELKKMIDEHIILEKKQGKNRYLKINPAISVTNEEMFAKLKIAFNSDSLDTIIGDSFTTSNSDSLDTYIKKEKETIKKDNNNTLILTNTMELYNHYLNEFGYEKDNVVEEVLDIFYEQYEYYKEQKHPKLTEEQLLRIYSVIRDMDEQYNAFYDTESTTTIIQEFFTTVHSNDHRLNHFATEGIISILQERYK